MLIKEFDVSNIFKMKQVTFSRWKRLYAGMKSKIKTIHELNIISRMRGGPLFLSKHKCSSSTSFLFYICIFEKRKSS